VSRAESWWWWPLPCRIEQRREKISCLRGRWLQTFQATTRPRNKPERIQEPVRTEMLRVTRPRKRFRQAVSLSVLLTSEARGCVECSVRNGNDNESKCQSGVSGQSPELEPVFLDSRSRLHALTT
jgi:hypothetical protein